MIVDLIVVSWLTSLSTRLKLSFVIDKGSRIGTVIIIIIIIVIIVKIGNEFDFDFQVRVLVLPKSGRSSQKKKKSYYCNDSG